MIDMFVYDLGIVLLLLLLAGGKARDMAKAKWSSATDRRAKLLKRAAQGASWLKDLYAIGVQEPLAGAVTRWIGIESGGDPLRASSLGERGLVQTLHKSIKSFGITEEEWRKMADPKTPRDEHLRIAMKEVIALMKSAPDGWNDPRDQIWWAKMRHGLPLLLKEAREQGLIAHGRFATRTALQSLKPSPRLLSYAYDRSLKGLLERFVIPADVVADGDTMRDVS